MNKNQTHLRTGDRGKRVASKVKIDLSSAQVINDDDIVTLVRKVKGSRPSAETISSQDNDLLLLARSIGSILGKDGGCRLGGGNIGLEAGWRKGRSDGNDNRKGDGKELHGGLSTILVL